MSLLNPQQRQDIRDAIKQVTDTFYTTPFVYYKKTLSYDRFGTGDDLYQQYDLLCIAEYPKTVNNTATFTGISKAQGQSILDWDSKVTLLVDDVQAQYPDLFSADEFTGVIGDDQAVLNGIRYTVVHFAKDGPLERKNILIELYLRRLEK